MTTAIYLSSPLTPAQVAAQAATGHVTWGPVAPELWDRLAGAGVILIASGQATYPARVTGYDHVSRELTVTLDGPGDR